MSWLFAVAVFACAAPVSAAPPATEKFEPQDEPPEHRQDFRFTTPKASVAVRFGWLFRTEGSDAYDLFQNSLTIEPGAFDSPQVEVDVARWLSTRTDLVIGLGYNRVEIASEARDFASRFSPTQLTELKEISLTGSYKYYLGSRGRQVGQLAWVSSRAVPYVGAGVGVARYRLHQSGVFVDADSMETFGATLESEGWAPLVKLFGGVDLRIGRSVFLSFEGRYRWGSAELSNDFRDFERFDLSGFSATVGILVVL